MLLKNAKIITMDDGLVVYGDILIKDKIISAIGENLSYSEEEVIDLKNMIILPGFIDISTTLGLAEAGIRNGYNQSSDLSRVCISDTKTIDGINYFDDYFKLAVESGITSVVVNSGKKNVIGGQSCLIKTHSNTFKNSIVSDCVDIECVIDDEAKRNVSNNKTAPMSRMGIMSTIREQLKKAKLYNQLKNEGEIEFSNYDGVLEGLIPVVNNKIPLKIYANKAEDILRCVEIKKEFKIDVMIDGAAEVYKVAEIVKNNNIPVIINSFIGDNSSTALINRKKSTPKLLAEMGIDIALTTNHPNISIDLLLLSACILAKEGLGYEDVFKSVTANPAKMLGFSERIGNIKVGKDADLVIFDGDPLMSMSSVVMTIIDGVVAYRK